MSKSANCLDYSLSRLWAAAYAMHKRTMHEGDRNKTDRSDEYFLVQFGNGNIPCDSSLKGFLAEYDVARNFGKEGTPTPGDLLDHVRKVTANWSTNMALTNKANLLIHDIPGSGCTKNSPQSAASKMAWFCKPEQWTLFDSRSSQALGFRSFAKFYEKLENLGFANWCTNAQKAFGGNDSKLYAE